MSKHLPAQFHEFFDFKTQETLESLIMDESEYSTVQSQITIPKHQCRSQQLLNLNNIRNINMIDQFVIFTDENVIRRQMSRRRLLYGGVISFIEVNIQRLWRMAVSNQVLVYLVITELRLNDDAMDFTLLSMQKVKNAQEVHLFVDRRDHSKHTDCLEGYKNLLIVHILKGGDLKETDKLYNNIMIKLYMGTFPLKLVKELVQRVKYKDQVLPKSHLTRFVKVVLQQFNSQVKHIRPILQKVKFDLSQLKSIRIPDFHKHDKLCSASNIIESHYLCRYKDHFAKSYNQSGQKRICFQLFEDYVLIDHYNSRNAFAFIIETIMKELDVPSVYRFINVDIRDLSDNPDVQKYMFNFLVQNVDGSHKISRILKPLQVKHVQGPQVTVQRRLGGDAQVRQMLKLVGKMEQSIQERRIMIEFIYKFLRLVSFQSHTMYIRNYLVDVTCKMLKEKNIGAMSVQQVFDYLSNNGQSDQMDMLGIRRQLDKTVQHVIEWESMFLESALKSQTGKLEPFIYRIIENYLSNRPSYINVETKDYVIVSSTINGKLQQINYGEWNRFDRDTQLKNQQSDTLKMRVGQVGVDDIMTCQSHRERLPVLVVNGYGNIEVKGSDDMLQKLMSGQLQSKRVDLFQVAKDYEVHHIYKHTERLKQQLTKYGTYPMEMNGVLNEYKFTTAQAQGQSQMVTARYQVATQFDMLMAIAIHSPAKLDEVLIHQNLYIDDGIYERMNIVQNNEQFDRVRRMFNQGQYRRIVRTYTMRTLLQILIHNFARFKLAYSISRLSRMLGIRHFNQSVLYIMGDPIVKTDVQLAPIQRQFTVAGLRRKLNRLRFMNVTFQYSYPSYQCALQNFYEGNHIKVRFQPKAALYNLILLLFANEQFYLVFKVTQFYMKYFNIPPELKIVLTKIGNVSQNQAVYSTQILNRSQQSKVKIYYTQVLDKQYKHREKPKKVLDSIQAVSIEQLQNRLSQNRDVRDLSQLPAKHHARQALKQFAREASQIINESPVMMNVYEVNPFTRSLLLRYLTQPADTSTFTRFLVPNRQQDVLQGDPQTEMLREHERFLRRSDKIGRQKFARRMGQSRRKPQPRDPNGRWSVSGPVEDIEYTFELMAVVLPQDALYVCLQCVRAICNTRILGYADKDRRVENAVTILKPYMAATIKYVNTFMNELTRMYNQLLQLNASMISDGFLDTSKFFTLSKNEYVAGCQTAGTYRSQISEWATVSTNLKTMFHKVLVNPVIRVKFTSNIGWQCGERGEVTSNLTVRKRETDKQRNQTLFYNDVIGQVIQGHSEKIQTSPNFKYPKVLQYFLFPTGNVPWVLSPWRPFQNIRWNSQLLQMGLLLCSHRLQHRLLHGVQYNPNYLSEDGMQRRTPPTMFNFIDLLHKNVGDQRLVDRRGHTLVGPYVGVELIKNFQGSRHSSRYTKLADRSEFSQEQFEKNGVQLLKNLQQDDLLVQQLSYNSTVHDQLQKQKNDRFVDDILEYQWPGQCSDYGDARIFWLLHSSPMFMNDLGNQFVPYYSRYGISDDLIQSAGRPNIKVDNLQINFDFHNRLKTVKHLNGLLVIGDGFKSYQSKIIDMAIGHLGDTSYEKRLIEFIRNKTTLQSLMASDRQIYEIIRGMYVKVDYESVHLKRNIQQEHEQNMEKGTKLITKVPQLMKTVLRSLNNEALRKSKSIVPFSGSLFGKQLADVRQCQVAVQLFLRGYPITQMNFYSSKDYKLQCNRPAVIQTQIQSLRSNYYKQQQRYNIHQQFDALISQIQSNMRSAQLCELFSLGFDIFRYLHSKQYTIRVDGHKILLQTISKNQLPFEDLEYGVQESRNRVFFPSFQLKDDYNVSYPFSSQREIQDDANEVIVHTISTRVSQRSLMDFTLNQIQAIRALQILIGLDQHQNLESIQSIQANLVNSVMQSGQLPHWYKTIRVDQIQKADDLIANPVEATQRRMENLRPNIFRDIFQLMIRYVSAQDPGSGIVCHELFLETVRLTCLAIHYQLIKEELAANGQHPQVRVRSYSDALLFQYYKLNMRLEAFLQIDCVFDEERHNRYDTNGNILGIQFIDGQSGSASGSGDQSVQKHTVQLYDDTRLIQALFTGAVDFPGVIKLNHLQNPQLPGRDSVLITRYNDFTFNLGYHRQQKFMLLIAKSVPLSDRLRHTRIDPEYIYPNPEERDLVPRHQKYRYITRGQMQYGVHQDMQFVYRMFQQCISKMFPGYDLKLWAPGSAKFFRVLYKSLFSFYPDRQVQSIMSTLQQNPLSTARRDFMVSHQMYCRPLHHYLVKIQQQVDMYGSQANTTDYEEQRYSGFDYQDPFLQCSESVFNGMPAQLIQALCTTRRDECSKTGEFTNRLDFTYFRPLSISAALLQLAGEWRLNDIYTLKHDLKYQIIQPRFQEITQMSTPQPKYVQPPKEKIKLLPVTFPARQSTIVVNDQEQKIQQRHVRGRYNDIQFYQDMFTQKTSKVMPLLSVIPEQNEIYDDGQPYPTKAVHLFSPAIPGLIYTKFNKLLKHQIYLDQAFAASSTLIMDWYVSNSIQQLEKNEQMRPFPGSYLAMEMLNDLQTAPFVYSDKSVVNIMERLRMYKLSGFRPYLALSLIMNSVIHNQRPIDRLQWIFGQADKRVIEDGYSVAQRYLGQGDLPVFNYCVRCGRRAKDGYVSLCMQTHVITEENRKDNRSIIEMNEQKFVQNLNHLFTSMQRHWLAQPETQMKATVDWFQPPKEILYAKGQGAQNVLSEKDVFNPVCCPNISFTRPQTYRMMAKYEMMTDNPAVYKFMPLVVTNSDTRPLLNTYDCTGTFYNPLRYRQLFNAWRFNYPPTKLSQKVQKWIKSVSGKHSQKYKMVKKGFVWFINCIQYFQHNGVKVDYDPRTLAFVLPDFHSRFFYIVPNTPMDSCTGQLLKFHSSEVRLPVSQKCLYNTVLFSKLRHNIGVLERWSKSNKYRWINILPDIQYLHGMYGNQFDNLVIQRLTSLYWQQLDQFEKIQLKEYNQLVKKEVSKLRQRLNKIWHSHSDPDIGPISGIVTSKPLLLCCDYQYSQTRDPHADTLQETIKLMPQQMAMNIQLSQHRLDNGSVNEWYHREAQKGYLSRLRNRIMQLGNGQSIQQIGKDTKEWRPITQPTMSAAYTIPNDYMFHNSYDIWKGSINLNEFNLSHTYRLVNGEVKRRLQQAFGKGADTRGSVLSLILLESMNMKKGLLPYLNVQNINYASENGLELVSSFAFNESPSYYNNASIQREWDPIFVDIWTRMEQSRQAVNQGQGVNTIQQLIQHWWCKDLTTLHTATFSLFGKSPGTANEVKIQLKPVSFANSVKQKETYDTRIYVRDFISAFINGQHTVNKAANKLLAQARDSFIVITQEEIVQQIPPEYKIQLDQSRTLVSRNTEMIKRAGVLGYQRDIIQNYQVQQLQRVGLDIMASTVKLKEITADELDTLSQQLYGQPGKLIIHQQPRYDIPMNPTIGQIVINAMLMGFQIPLRSPTTSIHKYKLKMVQNKTTLQRYQLWCQSKDLEQAQIGFSCIYIFCDPQIQSLIDQYYPLSMENITNLKYNFNIRPDQRQMVFNVVTGKVGFIPPQLVRDVKTSAKVAQSLIVNIRSRSGHIANSGIPSIFEDLRMSQEPLNRPGLDYEVQLLRFLSSGQIRKGQPKNLLMEEIALNVLGMISKIMGQSPQFGPEQKLKFQKEVKAMELMTQREQHALRQDTLYKLTNYMNVDFLKKMMIKLMTGQVEHSELSVIRYLFETDRYLNETVGQSTIGSKELDKYLGILQVYSRALVFGYHLDLCKTYYNSGIFEAQKNNINPGVIVEQFSQDQIKMMIKKRKTKRLKCNWIKFFLKNVTNLRSLREDNLVTYKEKEDLWQIKIPLNNLQLDRQNVLFKCQLKLVPLQKIIEELKRSDPSISPIRNSQTVNIINFGQQQLAKPLEDYVYKLLKQYLS